MRIKRKRLFFDIETSPNIGLFWTAGFKQTITPDSIIRERAIICICYKWEGEKKVHSLTWDKNQCDKKLLLEFMKVANSADEMIGHNGDRYDLAWIRTRCLFHSIPCFPTYTTIDTLKHARAKFRFNSNKLDYIGKFLGVGQKISTGGYGLWKNIVLHNCEKSLIKMVRYCAGDVRLLERVFERMKVHIPSKFHYGVAAGGHKSECPECGSEDLKIAQTRVSAAGVKRIQLQCKGCGKYHTVAATALKK
jgi:uncharacterized protein YprB with RNaseH-like and TPR domain